MRDHWYIYMTIALVAGVLNLVCGKFQIIKSKPLRIFIVAFVAAIVCWVIYDLIL